MKIISLETIAAMRSSADNYRKQAAANKDTEDAAVFETIAKEMSAVADQKAHERAYGTTRWITNVASGIGATSARAIIAAVEATTAVEEATAEGGYRVRLVYYYDPTTQTNRWATEYTSNMEPPAVADNELKEDAEFRFRQFTNMIERTW